MLPIYEQRYPEDERPRKAIETKQLWLDGNASDKELDAARDAARYAAGAAAWGAARATAWDAAWAAAWAAAGDAAGDAARAAARDAARDAAIKKYSGWINDMLLEALAAQEPATASQSAG